MGTYYRRKALLVEESALHEKTQATAQAGTNPSPPVMMGARPKGSSCSVDSRHSDFASPPHEEATKPYRTCAGRVMLDRADWTHYAQQDEARPGAFHLEWPESLRRVGPVMIPGESEGTYRQEHAKPHAPTFQGRVLRRKNGMKTAMSWGNAQERQAIKRNMKEAASSLRDDRDWFGPLMECHSDPEEGPEDLHTVLATGEVLPFSLALAVVYEYPCTLGQQQPDLYERLVYSSIFGIPLIAPAEAQGICVDHRREHAHRVAEYEGFRVGYVSDIHMDEGPHRDEVRNRWSSGGVHYECHHYECYVTATACMFFTSEEEYVVHWNSFHAAISLWFSCPVSECPYVAT